MPTFSSKRISSVVRYIRTRQSYVFIVALIILAIFSHIAWFSIDTILFQNDWLHRPSQTLPQSWDMAQTWKNFINFGGPNIQIGYLIVSILWPLVGFMEGDFDLAVKLTMMIPVAVLGFLSPYFAIRYITKNEVIAFSAALFYGSTTYFLLSQTVQLPIAFIYALCPFVFYLYVKALDTNKTRDWVWFSLIFSLGLCYEVRIMYLVVLILLIYTVFNYSLLLQRAVVMQMLKAGVIVVLLNSFWILPTIFGGIGSSVSEQTSTDLFGSWLFDLPHALSLSASGWTGGATTGKFILEPIQLYLWIIPLIAVLALLIRSKKVSLKLVLFFFTVALVGIFLTKQAEQPLNGAYQWLYDNFPGFSLFREASKFYLLTAFGYMGLISLALLSIRHINKKLFIAPLVAIMTVSLVNLIPLFTSEIGGVFKNRQEPQSYTTFNNQIHNDPTDFRTLWVPTYSQWTYFDIKHPRASISSLLSQDWKTLLPTNSGTTQTKIETFFKTPYAKDILDSSQIKYVAVPARDSVNDDNYFPLYGDDRSAYIKLLDSVPWLTRTNTSSTIAIYENKNFQKHISVSNNLLKVPKAMPLEEAYTFNKSILGEKGNDFTQEKKVQNTTPANTVVTDIYQDPYVLNAKNNILSSQVSTPKNYDNSLYYDVNRPHVSYTFIEDKINFTTDIAPTPQIGKQVISENKKMQLGSLPINSNKQYKISIGDTLNDLNTSRDRTHSLGTVTQPMSIYETSKEDLLVNGSFEDGLWQQNVSDCNPYDNKAILNQELDKKRKVAGKASLKLSSVNHIACTSSSPIKVNPDSEYALNYSYSVKNGQKAGYDLIFNDAAKTVLSSDQLDQTGYWKKMNIKFKVPKNATSLIVRLKGYPDASRQSTATTNYDQVKLTPLEKRIDLSGAYKQDFKQLRLENRNTISAKIHDSGYSYSNLISNPSLEKGLWQKEVGDCNDYDRKPNLSMRLSGAASHGSKSLELTASRHIACTGPSAITVKEGATYLFKFDYKAKKGESAGYYLGFDDQNNTNSFEKLDVDTNEWSNFSKVIHVPYGATKLSFNVYGFSKENNGIKNITKYDNFSLTRVPNLDNKYYLVSKTDSKYTLPKGIAYSLEDPTHKQVTIRGASDNFYLKMSEKYNKNWTIAQSTDQNLFTQSIPHFNTSEPAGIEHFELNGYMNGWSVNTEKYCKQTYSKCVKNTDGTYDINLGIEYPPQRWFNVGIAIGILSLIGIVLYLFIGTLTKKKNGRK